VATESHEAPLLAAVIFDMDGVIIDSESVWDRAKVSAAKRAGIEFTPDNDQLLRGFALREFASRLFRSRRLEPSEEDINQFERDADEFAIEFYKNTVSLQPGILDTLVSLSARGIKIGLCSNCPYKFIDLVLDRFAIRPYFQAVVSAHSLGHPKPHSRSYVVACDRLGILPTRAIVVEDTASGVTAALDAGIGRVMFIAEHEASKRNDERVYHRKSIQTALLTIKAFAEIHAGTRNDLRVGVASPHSCANIFTEEFFSSMYAEFDRWLLVNTRHHEVEEVGLAWLKTHSEPLKYSGYFKPYSRVSYGAKNKDQKAVLQIGGGFTDYCIRQQALPSLRMLQRYLDVIVAACPVVFSDMISDIKSVSPALARQIAPSEGPSLAARIIRYEGDSFAGTNLHVDKSALTCILHTSDLQGESKLVYVDQQGNLAPIRTGMGRGATFYGAALKQAGHSMFSPLIHGVTPISEGRIRYSTILFWLLPGLDLSRFSTSASTKPNLLEGSRQYQASSPGIG
jgi:HAD superfamily hydrolase (TIGR01509 family)